jgi:hypothetical protein
LTQRLDRTDWSDNWRQNSYVHAGQDRLRQDFKTKTGQDRLARQVEAGHLHMMERTGRGNTLTLRLDRTDWSDK